MNVDLGYCNVNFCLNKSVKDCDFCVDVSFCGIHTDHSKFHFRRCQYLGCVKDIAVRNKLPLDGLCFHSKFPPCLISFCRGSKFIFCKSHLNHDSHLQEFLPNSGYDFDCSEISVQNRSVFVCDSKESQLQILDVHESIGRQASSGSSILRGCEADRLGFGTFGKVDFIPISRKKRKTKSETFQNKKLSIDDYKATPVSSSPESRRYNHKCPYCYRTIRNVIFDAKIGMRTHWVWHCVISGTTEVDKLLEISNGVYVHHPDQLVPLEFLPSAYYRMSMYRKSCADGSNSSEKVCFIFSSIN